MLVGDVVVSGGRNEERRERSAKTATAALRGSAATGRRRQHQAAKGQRGTLAPGGQKGDAPSPTHQPPPWLLTYHTLGP